MTIVFQRVCALAATVLVSACGGGGGGGNSAPTGITLSSQSIVENSPGGSEVGTLSTTDPDPGDTHSYTLLDDAGGRFIVDGGALAVADGAGLDFETAPNTYTITVRSTDAGGESVEESFSVSVTDAPGVSNLSDSGAGSLRDAIANAGPSGGVEFESGLALPGTITLTSEISITEDLVVAGPGLDQLTVSGGGTNRVFSIAAGNVVSMTDLTIADGAGGTGSAISNQGELNLTRVVVRDSSSSSFGRAGGIRNDGTLSLAYVELSGNSAFNGGGIDNRGTLTAYATAFINNDATGNSGGAVINAGGTASFLNCTFRQNDADPGGSSDRVGGAIAIFGGTVQVAFSSFELNTASGEGGAIYVTGSSEGGPAELQIKASVLGNNSAVIAGNAIYDSASMTTVTSGGYNVIDDGDGSGLTDGVNGDQIGTTASPLAVDFDTTTDVSGYLTVLRLLSTSPAVDNIPPAECTAFDGSTVDLDQASQSRPGGSACDSGAWESN